MTRQILGGRCVGESCDGSRRRRTSGSRDRTAEMRGRGGIRRSRRRRGRPSRPRDSSGTACRPLNSWGRHWRRKEGGEGAYDLLDDGSSLSPRMRLLGEMEKP